MLERGFGDGLPLVPPTRERVERMLRGMARTSGDVVGKIPHSYAPAPLEAGAAAAKFSHPSHIQITVAGSTAGKRTCICPGNVRRMDPEHMDCFTPVSERIETL